MLLKLIGHKDPPMPTNCDVETIREHVMPVAPQGMKEVHLNQGWSRSQANENALTVAMMKYA